VADKTLKTIRSFTAEPIKILVNTHIHPDHTGANAFFAGQGAVIFSQVNLQSEMLRPPARANGQPAPAPEKGSVPVATYQYDPTAPGKPAITFDMNAETVDFIPMMLTHCRRHDRRFHNAADLIEASTATGTRSPINNGGSAGA
jgi:glyoxylase-like metal-dependent hydrolase (beta-lactamase superfamily II)